MTVSVKQFYQALYEEHLEEGAFLYESLQPWRADPEGSWSDCAALEEDLEAHIDALVIGEDVALKLLEDKIAEAEPGELFVITAVFCRQSAVSRVSKLWEMLIGTPEDLRQATTEESEAAPDADLIAKIKAVAYALRLEYPQPFRSKFPKLLESPLGPLLPIIGSTVDELGELTTAAARNLLARCPAWYLPQAARFAGNSGNKALASDIEPLLDHADPLVKKEAAIALLKIGQFGIMAKLLRDPEIFAVPLAFSGDADATRALLRLAKSESASYEVITALGFSGQLAAVKPLVKAMADEALATTAANAVQLILGADLVEDQFVEEPFKEEDLFEEELEAFKAGNMPRHPAGQPYGNNIEKVVTDPECWRQWLRENRQRFNPQQAYRLGEPFSAQSVCRSLYKPGVPFDTRRYIHDEMVIRFSMNIPFNVIEPVNTQMANIQLIANWVQENQQ